MDYDLSRHRALVVRVQNFWQKNEAGGASLDASEIIGTELHMVNIVRHIWIKSS